MRKKKNGERQRAGPTAGRFLFPVVIAFALSACGVSRDNGRCTWAPKDSPSRLNLEQRSHQLHLMDEAIAAEDLAIRHADVTRGHRSGHFAGIDVYRQARERCMATVFDALAAHHGVSNEQIRRALGDRRWSVDVIVLASFAVVYVLMCSGIARWIFRAVPVDRLWARTVATAMAAAAIAPTGLVCFALYGAFIEMLRIGNTHLSYRVGRSPWAGHLIQLLVGGIVLFALVAGYRHFHEWREGRRSPLAGTADAFR